MHDYQLAILKWKEENPDKLYLDIPLTAKVKLEGIGIVKLGSIIGSLRGIYQAIRENREFVWFQDLTQEEIDWLNKEGMIWDSEKFQQEVYQQAILKWKEEHPDQKYLDIPVDTVIELEGIGQVKLGPIIGDLRKTYQAMQEGRELDDLKELTEEEIDWLNSQGMIWNYEKFQQEVYQQAILKWKEGNPNKWYLDIPIDAVIELEGIGPVNIGLKIASLRAVYHAMQEGRKLVNSKYLTQEEIDWLNSQGMIWDFKKFQQEVFHQAILKWKEENPDKLYLDIPANAIIELEGIGPVNLGFKIACLRSAYLEIQKGWEPVCFIDLTKEEIDWLNSQGMIWDYEKYLNDILPQTISRNEEEHPSQKQLKISKKTRTSLPNTKDTVLDYDEHNRKIYHQAILKWKEKHPDKKYLDIHSNARVKLDGIGMVKLGSIIGNLREIYQAVQEGKEVGISKDLIQEEIAWLDSQGMIWNYEKFQRDVFHQAILKWKEKHPDKKYLDTLLTTKVKLDGIGIVKLGSIIYRLRDIYQAMQEGKEHVDSKALNQEEIDWLNSQGMIWNKEKYLRNAFHQAILKWKEENPDKLYLDIPARTVIKLEGIGTVSVGSEISRLRKLYQAMQEGGEIFDPKALDQEEIAWLTKVGMIWDYEKFQRDIFRKAILKWKEEHPEQENLDITKKTIIELEGIGPVKLGVKISTARGIYNAMLEGKHYGSCQDLTKEEIVWFNNEGMIWNRIKYQKEADKKEHEEKFDGEQLDDYCIMMTKSEIQSRQSRKTQNFNEENIKSEFAVDEETLQKQFGRTKTLSSKKRDTSLYEDPVLKKYCSDHGYNYDVISNAIRLHRIFPEDSLEEIMNQSIIDYNMIGQNKIATWIYEKYGNYVKPVLTNLNLDSDQILRNMSEQTLTLEEAIRHFAFLSCINGKKEDTRLEAAYNDLVAEVDLSKGEKQSITDAELMTDLIAIELELNEDESSIIMNSFMKYMNTMKEYALYDVGLETDDDVRLQKIYAYGLDELDVEESFFKPLEFDQGVLIGKQRELYKRRQLLRQCAIDWGLYTEEEKANVVSNNNFTTEEVSYLNNARTAINKDLAKMKKK